MWASSPHLRSKSKLHHEIKQKSKSKSQRIAIAFRNKKVVVRHEVSGAIAIPQASWGCAPALPNRMQMVFLRQAAGNQKFFDPTIFQKCWRGSGRVALIAVRRQRNPRAILLAHGVGGEKSDRFSRRSEQDRRLVRPYQQTSILQLFRGNSCNENALQKILLLEKTVFSVRQKGVLPLLLPASML